MASKAQFTPGPWYAADGGVVWHETVIDVSHPECCGDIKPNGECCGLSVQGSHQELAQEQIVQCSPEDANLIAAAPELYEALTKARAQFEFYVQAHLAKQPPDMDKAATNQEFVELCDAALAKADGAHP